MRRARRPRRAFVDRRAAACLALALVALGAALAATLAHAARHRTGTNGVWIAPEVGPVNVDSGTVLCQGDELVPAGTAAVQLAVGTAEPRLVVTLRRHGRVLDRVAAPAEPREGVVATIRPPERDLDAVEVCAVSRHQEIAVPRGHTPPGVAPLTVGGDPPGGSMRIDYLERDARSWAAQALTIAHRFRLGRGQWLGGWTAWLVVALLLASLGIAGGIVLRSVLRPLAPSAWAIAAVAVLNAAAWSFLTPAFQVPDEVAHVAYVQHIGETGGPPPRPDRVVLSPELMTTMADTRFGSIEARTLEATVWAPPQQQHLRRDLAAPLSRRPFYDVGDGEPEPPLYYLLDAIPYRLAHGASLLDRMALMRLFSALLAGATALLCFLFVRECLPRRPWAWAVGGLAVAFTPMLGFISGGVTPDALLFAVSAALFLCLARAFRRGVTSTLALWTGGAIAAGLLTKVNLYGLVPVALVAFALAARRSEGAWNRRVAGHLGRVVALGALPFAAVSALDAAAWGRPLAIGRAAAPESHVGLLHALSYMWQIYLPRLPGQAKAFPDAYPAYHNLFQTFVGAFGTIVVRFSGWAYTLALGAFGVVGLLAARVLVAERVELRRRRVELCCYAGMAVGLLALIALSTELRREIVGIVQGRYLLPLLPLFGALVALAARGAGERWGRAAGAVLVVAAVGWTLFGQLLTVAFFYG
jgi:hypothetical protein